MLKKVLTFSVIIFLTVTVVTGMKIEAEDGYIGAETCMECHEDHYQSYMTDYHANPNDPGTPGAGYGCEACHGPGAAHAESEGDESMVSMGPKSSAPAEQKNAGCLSCHTQSNLALWHGSSHDQRGLSCSDCHSVHAGFKKSRAKATQTEMCARCHHQIKGELMKQSHHPIREGKMNCSDCHDPHGTIADKLVDSQYANLKCFECHADKRGPYLWDHPPVIEDCLTCHTPHGSPRTPLLKAKMPYLCQRCHSNVGHPSELAAKRSDQSGLSVYRVLNNRAYYRACLNCHTPIHGSNHPSGKSLLR
jgi:DmsE family decaheme c-type cytochrome